MGKKAVLRQVLDDAEASIRVGDLQRAFKVIFVWSQRKEYLLSGEESWEDQNIGGFHQHYESEIDG